MGQEQTEKNIALKIKFRNRIRHTKSESDLFFVFKTND